MKKSNTETKQATALFVPKWRVENKALGKALGGNYLRISVLENRKYYLEEGNGGIMSHRFPFFSPLYFLLFCPAHGRLTA